MDTEFLSGALLAALPVAGILAGVWLHARRKPELKRTETIDTNPYRVDPRYEQR